MAYFKDNSQALKPVKNELISISQSEKEILFRVVSFF